MAITQVRAEQLKSVKRSDLDVTTSGSAVVAKIVAGSGVTLSSSGTDIGTGDVTISASGSSGVGYTWNDVTGTTQAATVNNAYVADNASLVTVTLPSTAAIGDRIMVLGAGAGGWKLAQNASQVVKFNNGSSTTTGTGGYLVSGQITDVVEVTCIVANTTWLVTNSTWAVSTDGGAYTNPSCIVDKYTANGTWTNRPGVAWVRVIAWGSGGAGGSGRKGAAGTVRCGGGGGAGGAKAVADFQASMLGSTESVTVGASATGGGSQSTNSTNGNAGANGNFSQFSSLRTGTSAAGAGGTASTGAAGGSSSSGIEFVTSTGGAGGAASTIGGGGSLAGTGFGRPAGGGGGGGIQSSDVANSGGNGGGVGGPPSGQVTEVSFSSGGGVGSAGANGNSLSGDMSPSGGGGGAGGGASITGNAGAGGNGGTPGGGGGGGGAALDGTGNSGAGGAGARGEVWIINFF